VAALTAWLFAVGALVFLYAMVSKRLSTTIVTGPMLFVTVGLIIGSSGNGKKPSLTRPLKSVRFLT
jgi:hypothetical protein